MLVPTGDYSAFDAPSFLMGGSLRVSSVMQELRKPGVFRPAGLCF